MASTLLNLEGGAPSTARTSNGETGHRFRLRVAWFLAAASVVALSVYGFSYYRLSLEARPFSPLHAWLKPSGSIGLKLGMIGFGLYCILFIYPIRKRVKWLGKIGKTRHWLDFHVLVGILAPVLITFHASFKLAGIAGVAYWIMIAVALSGFIGRYIYAQIPRSLNAVELSLGELAGQVTDLAAQLARQNLFQAGDLSALLRVPTPDEVRAMTLGQMLWAIFRLDLMRPLLIARLRRRILHGWRLVTTLGGLLASNQADLETVISAVRRQAGLRVKMAFLDRTEQIFHLWHVIHRPFSYSFAVLVVIHVGVVLMMGYY
jgi:hypothetical protein